MDDAGVGGAGVVASGGERAAGTVEEIHHAAGAREGAYGFIGGAKGQSAAVYGNYAGVAEHGAGIAEEQSAGRDRGAAGIGIGAGEGESAGAEFREAKDVGARVGIDECVAEGERISSGIEAEERTGGEATGGRTQQGECDDSGSGELAAAADGENRRGA